MQSIKLKALAMMIATAALFGPGLALAVDDPNAVAAAAAITGLQANATLLFNAAWPVVLFITGGLILIKLFKRVSNRAT